MANYSFKSDIQSKVFVINELRYNPNLTEWEKGFIENIHNHYITENKFLSAGQLQTLSDIWEKY